MVPGSDNVQAPKGAQDLKRAWNKINQVIKRIDRQKDIQQDRELYRQILDILKHDKLGYQEGLYPTYIMYMVYNII